MFGLFAFGCFGFDQIPEPPGKPGRPDSAPVYDDTGEGIKDCEANRFDLLGQDWKLPPGFPEGSFDLPYDTSSESPNWVLMDLDGDLAQELVVTYWEGLAGVGTSRWLVYDDEADGFAGTATDWALPTGFPENTFQYAYDTSSESPNWGLASVDSDDVPELVVTSYDPIPELGSSAWRVFANEGTGFASSGVDWSLPTGFPSGTFNQLSDSSSESPNWVLLDVDGDGDRDMVGTEYDGIDGLGDTRWLVYRNEAGSWSPSGDTWNLPSGFAGGEFSTHYDRSTSSSPDWTLADLTGDGVPELVVSWWEGFEGVGSTQWMVYPPDPEGGFQAVSQSWSLPEAYPEGTFRLAWDTSADGMDWSLLDLDADGALELVIHRETHSGNAPTVGTTKWLVHDNMGTGFAKAPDNWVLPNGYPDQTFPAASGSSDVAYVLRDLDGDSLTDLVVTRRSDLEVVGESLWLHYPALCD